MTYVKLVRGGRALTSGELRQEVCLAFIDAYWLANWTSPTVRQIGEAIGLSSPASCHKYLGRLVAEGALEVRQVSAKRVLYRRRAAAV